MERDEEVWTGQLVESAIVGTARLHEQGAAHGADRDRQRGDYENHGSLESMPPDSRQRLSQDRLQPASPGSRIVTPLSAVSPPPPRPITRLAYRRASPASVGAKIKGWPPRVNPASSSMTFSPVRRFAAP